MQEITEWIEAYYGDGVHDDLNLTQLLEDFQLHLAKNNLVTDKIISSVLCKKCGKIYNAATVGVIESFVFDGEQMMVAMDAIQHESYNIICENCNSLLTIPDDEWEYMPDGKTADPFHMDKTVFKIAECKLNYNTVHI